MFPNRFWHERLLGPENYVLGAALSTGTRISTTCPVKEYLTQHEYEIHSEMTWTA